MHYGPAAFRFELAGELDAEGAHRLELDWLTASSVIGEHALIVDLTFVTGALNKLGSHLALAARATTPPDVQGSWDTHLRRAGLEGGLWLAFCAGAVLAGFVTKRAGGFELIPAVGILLFFALLSRDH